MKVLISGGAGFIGSHVAEELSNNGYEVVIVDNLTTGKQLNVSNEFKFYKLNLDDPALEYVFERERPHYVIHLAAQASVTASMRDPYDDFYTNTAGTLKLLLLSKKYDVKRFLFASTAAVYGEPCYLPIDEMHQLNPQSYYAQSKLSAESYIRLYNTLNGLNSCTLRFSNVYGPRQNPDGEAGVIAIFINKILKEERPIIYDGMQTRDFIFVKDVAQACRLALESEAKGVFNVSSGVETTIRDLYYLIAQEFHVPIQPIYKPKRPGEIERSVLDNHKAMQNFQWVAKHTLKKGIKETIEAYQESMSLLNKEYGDHYENRYENTNHYV